MLGTGTPPAARPRQWCCEWSNNIKWETTITICGNLITRIDAKGRVLIPREVREAAGLKPGSRVSVTAEGHGIVVIRLLERDPSEELAEILGDFSLDREARRRAESLLLGELLDH